MPRKSNLTTKGDVGLLRWWREWLDALHTEMAAADQGDEERRHKRVEMLQRTIANTPSEGLVGIGVKLALANFLAVSLTVLMESQEGLHNSTRLDY